MKQRLETALISHQDEFGLSLTVGQISGLTRYHQLVMLANDLLHLVAPCEPEVFAVRHLLESLFASRLLPEGAAFTDLGSGAGLPGIPLALVREDLTATLVESKPKKSRFLEETADRLEIGDRVKVVNSAIEEMTLPQAGYVLVRALDKFGKKLPRILKKAAGREAILFGGARIESVLIRGEKRFQRILIPRSERRFIFRVSA